MFEDGKGINLTLHIFIVGWALEQQEIKHAFFTPFVGVVSKAKVGCCGSVCGFSSL